MLPTTLGPIKVEDLTLLEGWMWDMYNIGYPGAEIALTRGGPITTLANYTDEKGWLMFLGAVFRSPYGVITFNADSWLAAVSPYYMNAMGETSMSHLNMYCSVYNPFTPLGPMYGIAAVPTRAVPYARRLSVTLNLPAAVPIAATTLHRAAVGKIWIQDEGLFLRSIKRHIIEQMTGKRMERYP